MSPQSFEVEAWNGPVATGSSAPGDAVDMYPGTTHRFPVGYPPMVAQVSSLMETGLLPNCGAHTPGAKLTCEGKVD